MERVLLHTCCAPCSLSCIDPLRSEGIEPVAFWYNPNIHPWKEYQARRDCLLAYAPAIGMEVRWYRRNTACRTFVGTRGRETSTTAAPTAIDHRLEGTARYAAEHGYTAFTSTLLASTLSGSRRPSGPPPRNTPGSTAWSSSTGTSAPISGPGTSGPGSWAFICRNTAAASFPRQDRYQKQIDRDRAKFDAEEAARQG